MMVDTWALPDRNRGVTARKLKALRSAPLVPVVKVADFRVLDHARTSGRIS
jgi:hypothetical protein